ncbi:MAG: tetratricopeptide repeat protein [Planctomycetota bacterium]|nr:tetratricopeptide repeat protein [Planctomycetota bacterium]
MNPNLASAYYNRGIVLKSLGKTEAAIADFTKALDLKTN